MSITRPSPPPSRDKITVSNGVGEFPLTWLKFFERLYAFTREPVTPPTYTTATKPAASNYPGGIIYVSDGGAGAVFQGSNGTSWVNLG